MIEVQHLSRLYGNVTAVEDVSFHIGRGEIIGLLGHNGAGKTTIMRMLSGYLEPSAGSITIDGQNMVDQSRKIQQQLGYLPENLPVYPDMLVADYLDYAATLKGIASRQRMAAVREALLATELNDRALQAIATLSRGFRQRVGVAQAILGTPRLLILDEPTNGLDPRQTQQMRDLIKNLSRRATVILSTHIMQEVDAVCDRVLILRNGHLALDKSLAQLRTSRTLVLRTDDKVHELHVELDRLQEVANLEQEDGAEGTRVYHLHLRDHVEQDDAAAKVADCVVRSGAQLYQLDAPGRDLDTVFREVDNRGH